MKRKLPISAMLMLPFLLVLSGCNVGGGSNSTIPKEINIKEELTGLEKVEFLNEAAKAGYERLSSLKAEVIAKDYDEDFGYETLTKLSQESKLFVEGVETKTKLTVIQEETLTKVEASLESERLKFDYENITYDISVEKFIGEDYIERTFDVNEVVEDYGTLDAFYDNYTSDYYEIDIDEFDMFLATDGFYYAVQMEEVKDSYYVYTGYQNTYEKEMTIYKYNKKHELLAIKKTSEARGRLSDHVITDIEDITLLESIEFDFTFKYEKRKSLPKIKEKVASFPEYAISTPSTVYETHNVVVSENGEPSIEVSLIPPYDFLTEEGRETREDGSARFTYTIKNLSIPKQKAIRISVKPSATLFDINGGVVNKTILDYQTYLDLGSLNNSDDLPENYKVIYDENGVSYLANLNTENDNTKFHLNYDVIFHTSRKADGTWEDTIICEIANLRALVSNL